MSTRPNSTFEPGKPDGERPRPVWPADTVTARPYQSDREELLAALDRAHVHEKQCWCHEATEARLAEAERLLAYLWIAEIEVNVAALDGGKVRDLFHLDDPLVYDINNFLADPGPEKDDDPISDARQPEDGPPPGRWPR